MFVCERGSQIGEQRLNGNPPPPFFLAVTLHADIAPQTLLTPFLVSEGSQMGRQLPIVTVPQVSGWQYRPGKQSEFLDGSQVAPTAFLPAVPVKHIAVPPATAHQPQLLQPV